MNTPSNVMLFITNIVCSLYIFVIMLRIMLEWLQIDYYHLGYQLILKLTDMPIKPLQAIIPRSRFIDIPAIVFLLIVELLKLFLFSLLIANLPQLSGLLLWAIFDLIKEFINLYFYMILFFVILSWLENNKVQMLALLLFRLVDPLLRQARNVIPLIAGIDFSPLAVMVVLKLVNILLAVPMINMAIRLALT